MVLFGKTTEIGDDTILRRNPDILFNEIDGEVVMLSIENSEYYGINRIGSRIWQMLDESKPIHELIENLAEEFDVNIEQCRKDSLVFIQEMLDKKLLNII